MMSIGTKTIKTVAVVVVTYNSAMVLGACLSALLDASLGVEITDVIIVDNASTDDTLKIAAMACALPLRICQLGRNVGYAAGFNAGVAALAGREPDAVLVINPDCQLQPGSVDVMARSLRDGRGIVAPRLLNPDGSLQPTLRRMPTARRALAEAVLGGERAGHLGSLAELIFDEDTHMRPGPTVWATGAALLISWETLTDVGPWDESFLLYSEETEFMLRAADNGWSIWYEPDATVIHKGGDSGTNPSLAALLVVNKVKLYRRRHNRVDSAAYCSAVLLGELIRALAGRKTAQASVAALLMRSRRVSSLAEIS